MARDSKTDSAIGLACACIAAAAHESVAPSTRRCVGRPSAENGAAKRGSIGRVALHQAFPEYRAGGRVGSDKGRCCSLPLPLAFSLRHVAATTRQQHRPDGRREKESAESAAAVHGIERGEMSGIQAPAPTWQPPRPAREVAGACFQFRAPKTLSALHSTS